MKKRSKVFFINGGAGRVVCSIPAFENYIKESGDTDFAIVAESGYEIYTGHEQLHDKVYSPFHKNLFRDVIKNRDIIQPEPYRINEYYNQECSLAQAFDMEINHLDSPRELQTPSIPLFRDEIANAIQMIEEIKEKSNKEKAIVFQPFGRGIRQVKDDLIDDSYRSLELENVKKIVEYLRKKFAIILMTEIQFPISHDEKNPVALPSIPNIRTWASVIKMADYFLGCDSMGQHLAKAMGTKSTVVIGSTFPINVSYPNDDLIDIVDIGLNRRTYVPLRITDGTEESRKNENIMFMNKENIKQVYDSIESFI